MKPGRPREFDSESALNAAVQQFWLTGYEATSLQDLLGVMDLSKSSFYQTYGSKHELFLRSIACYQQASVSELQKRLDESINSKNFMLHLLENTIAEADSKYKKGCFLVNTVNELAGRDKAVAKALATGFSNVSAVIREAIIRGKKEGLIRSTKDTDTLVNYIISNISGLRTMVKSGVNKTELNSLVSLIMKTVY
jgi:TetR/AcrR family transcriptional repressor of nem operon